MNIRIDIIIPFLHNIVHALVQGAIAQHALDKAVAVD